MLIENRGNPLTLRISKTSVFIPHGINNIKCKHEEKLREFVNALPYLSEIVDDTVGSKSVIKPNVKKDKPGKRQKIRLDDIEALMDEDEDLLIN